MTGSAQDADLSLRVFADDAVLVLEVHNNGAGEVRLWEQDNSWGWPMARVHVRTSPADAATDLPTDSPADTATDAPAYLVYPAQRVWTANLPGFVSLPQGGAMQYRLAAADLDPAALAPLLELSDQPLRVQGELRCETSEQAVEYDVWCGTLLSDETLLDPPHRWLRLS